MSSEDKFDTWAIVDLFGHSKVAGRVTEAAIAGGAFIRVDVPEVKGQPEHTRYFGPAAIYSISPVSEAVARHLAECITSAPVSIYDLPRLAAGREAEAQNEEDDENNPF